MQNPPPGATTTGLSVTPAGPVVAGTNVTLKATVSPSAAAGSVQFSDGGSALGAPVTVAGGIASTTVTPALGSHSYTASFTPTDTTSYQPSSSAAVSLTVIPPATPTTTTLDISPVGPVDFGTAVTFTATVTATNAGDPAPTGGTVRFSDGSTVLGNPALTGGTATLTTSSLPGGAHSITARYLPADSTAFSPSQSAAGTLTVNAQPTSTMLSVSPAGKATVGSAVTLTATVAPGTAAGSVGFGDGSTSLGTVPVKSGKATLTTTTLALGDHSLTASFTPTDSAKYTSSTSAAVSLTLVAAPKVTEVTVGGKPVPAGTTLKPGDKVTLTGSGFQPDETVAVLLDSASDALATGKADSSGAVEVSVTLPSHLAAGAHLLRLRGSFASAAFRFAVAAAPTPAPSTSSPLQPGGSSGGGLSGGSAGGGSSSGGGLAFTGAKVTTGLGAALLLVLGGAGLLLGSRRRREH